MEAATEVDRLRFPAPEFESGYLDRRQPVVLSGIVGTWQASHLWSFDYLRQVAGGASVDVIELEAADGAFGADRSFVRREMLLERYLDLVEGGEGPRYYMLRCSVSDKLPALLADFELPGWLAPPQVREQNVFISGGGTRTRLHYDHWDNAHAVITGSKRFVLFDPGQMAQLYLYPEASELRNLSRVDLDQPDYERYPGLRQARPRVARVEAGDLLFLPSCWGHHVVTEGPSISLNFWWGGDERCPLWRRLTSPRIPLVTRLMRRLGIGPRG